MMTEHKRPRAAPPKEELAKMQFLQDMTYNHDGWTGRMKQWHYDVVYDRFGGDDLSLPLIGEYKWN